MPDIWQADWSEIQNPFLSIQSLATGKTFNLSKSLPWQSQVIKKRQEGKKTYNMYSLSPQKMKPKENVIIQMRKMKACTRFQVGHP